MIVDDGGDDKHASRIASRASLRDGDVMRITDSVIDIPVSFGVVRCAVVRPVGDGRHPLLLCFADIFGNTDAHFATQMVNVDFDGVALHLVAPTVQVLLQLLA